MKTKVETLKEMVDIAIAFNPGDKKVVITNDGTYIKVTRIVKKISATDITSEQINQVVEEKSEQYPDFEITYVDTTTKKN